MDLEGDEATGDNNIIDWAALDEDADVCLTVFQALSSNSNAARLARDMMQRLKETRINSQGELSGRSQPGKIVCNFPPALPELRGPTAHPLLERESPLNLPLNWLEYATDWTRFGLLSRESSGCFPKGRYASRREQNR
jgi:hypothetical protein